MKVQLPQNHAGAYGMGLTAGTGLASHIVALTPLLQSLSLIASILAGFATVCWYIYKFATRNRK